METFAEGGPGWGLIDGPDGCVWDAYYRGVEGHESKDSRRAGEEDGNGKAALLIGILRYPSFKESFWASTLPEQAIA